MLTRPLSRLVLVAAAVLSALAAFLALTGGGRLTFLDLALSLRDWRRPATLAALLLVGRWAYLRRNASQPGYVSGIVKEATGVGLGAISLLMCGLGWRYLDTACGGLDSHGYVSAAALISTGHLSVPQPLVDWLPFDRAIEALSPLGYVPSLDARAIVPRFPLGLPVVMALFSVALGTNGPFYVAPVLGAATTLMTFAIVRREAGSLAGGLASVLVAAHPVFVTYSLQPMSDVPATFWVVLTVWLLHREQPLPMVAGMAAGMAMLTRPPLVLAGVVMALMTFKHRRPDGSRFLIGFIPFAIILFAIQTTLYGSPALSGYGRTEDLFSFMAIPRNLHVYGKWILSLHTPVLLLLLAATWPVRNRPFVILAFLLFAAVAAPYMLYVPSYDDWETLRFLLPGLVFLIMVAAWTATRLSERWFGDVAAALLTLAVACAVAAGSYTYLQNRQVFQLWLAESKYPGVAEWLKDRSDRETIVFASLHSGSVRYYSGRTTIRWDRIPPDRFATTVERIADRGRRMFLVLDGNSEREEFAQRLGAITAVDVDFIDRYHNVSLATIRPSKR